MAKEVAKGRVNTLFLNNFIKKLLQMAYLQFLSLKIPKLGIEMNQESWNIRIKTFVHVGHLEGAK